MKKYFALLLALLLPACSLLPSSEKPVDQNQAANAVYPYVLEQSGLLESVARMQGQLYTHNLTDANGLLIIPVRSSTLNLNEYLNEEIIAVGKVNLASDNKTEVLDVEKITRVNPIEDMEFSDPTLDFSFTYSSLLKVRVQSDGVKIFTKSGETFGNVIASVPSALTLDEAVNAIPLAGRRLSEEPIELNSSSAIRRIEIIDDKKITTVFLLGAKNFYTLELLNPIDMEESDSRKLFNQIVESFDASDLSAASVGEGSFCGGILGVACPTGLICLLDGAYPDAGGTCASAELITESVNTIREMCNQTEGYLNESGKEVCSEGSACTVLPTCVCSGSRVWDQLAGCVPANSVPELNQPDTTTTATSTSTATTSTSTTTTTSSSVSTDVLGEISHMAANKAYGFELDYPHNWYYMGTSGGLYYFSPNEDVIGSNTAVIVSQDSACASSSTVTCVTLGGKTFSVEGKEGYTDIAAAMAQTLTLSTAE